VVVVVHLYVNTMEVELLIQTVIQNYLLQEEVVEQAIVVQEVMPLSLQQVV